MIWYQLTRQSIAATWSRFLSWSDLSGFPILSPSPTHILSEISITAPEEGLTGVGGGAWGRYEVCQSFRLGSRHRGSWKPGKLSKRQSQCIKVQPSPKAIQHMILLSRGRFSVTHCWRLTQRKKWNAWTHNKSGTSGSLHLWSTGWVRVDVQPFALYMLDVRALLSALLCDKPLLQLTGANVAEQKH